MKTRSIAILAFVVVCASSFHAASGATLFGLVDTGELFASDDGGVTWTVRSTLAVSDAIAIAAGESSDELFMATRSGLVYRSGDGGLNWTAIGAVALLGVGILVVGDWSFRRYRESFAEWL